MKRIKQKEIFIPIIVGFITFLILFSAIKIYEEIRYKVRKEEARNSIFKILVLKKSNLEKSLNSRLYYTKGLAAAVSVNPNITKEEFENLAAEIIQNDSVISTMSLAKDCKINAIFPIQGHKEALGLNLLEHPKRKIIVENTIKTKRTFVAGPVELVEGGIAFISYTPIFIHSKNKVKFWGVTDIVIYRDKLFKEVNLNEYDKNLKYSMKGIDGNGASGETFFGDSTIFYQEHIYVDIDLPTGSWRLAAVPHLGLNNYISKREPIFFILYSLSTVLSFLIGLLVNAIIRIRESEQELKALFEAMDSVVLIFNRNGEYVKIAPTNENLLYLPKEKLLGKSLYEIFKKEEADFFFDAIKRCFETKKKIIIDYPLTVDEKLLWFQAHISYISENEVLLLAFDNTYNKNIEKDLVDSEEQLIKLNATKDKFFSIIAHDLRSPFQVLLGLSDLLVKQNSFSDEQKNAMMIKLNNALNLQYSLLTDLLEWARVQTKDYKLNLERVNIRNEVINIIETYELLAQRKDIRIQNKINENLDLIIDLNMMRLVFRNLIANAIKFSYSGGTIEILSKDENGFVKFIIRDYGVGIDKESLPKLFRTDIRISKPGTAEEKGTGLGLILCKEIVEKHNGKIWIESEMERGTQVIFTISKNLG